MAGPFLPGEDRDLYAALLFDARFHDQLLALDADLAADARALGCGRCGGVLHSAHYQRKPRGLPAGQDAALTLRCSFCCAVDGCRKRRTPPSFRFLGRKVWLGVVVVLMAALERDSEAALERLFAVTGRISARTLSRWRAWWRERFVASRLWRAGRSAFMPPVDVDRLPASLLERFAGSEADRLVALLRWLLPITGGAAMQAA